MEEKFIMSKNVLGIVEFDKSHQLWRACANPDQVYVYHKIEKVSIIETLQGKQKVDHILSGVAATMSAPVSFAQPSAFVKIQIKVITKDEDIVFDVSKDYVRQNTLDYHDDKRKAEEVKKFFKVLIKRNQE